MRTRWDGMPHQRQVLDKLSIYVPQKALKERPIERLIKLGEKHDRSVNYLVVEAILQYLEREESSNGGGRKSRHQCLSKLWCMFAHQPLCCITDGGME